MKFAVAAGLLLAAMGANEVFAQTLPTQTTQIRLEFQDNADNEEGTQVTVLFAHLSRIWKRLFRLFCIWFVIILNIRHSGQKSADLFAIFPW